MSNNHPRFRHCNSAVCREWSALVRNPDSKAHGSNMGPIWGRQNPGEPHVGPMNLAIWEVESRTRFISFATGFPWILKMNIVCSMSVIAFVFQFADYEPRSETSRSQLSKFYLMIKQTVWKLNFHNQLIFIFYLYNRQSYFDDLWQHELHSFDIFMLLILPAVSRNHLTRLMFMLLIQFVYKQFEIFLSIDEIHSSHETYLLPEEFYPVQFETEL